MRSLRAACIGKPFLLLGYSLVFLGRGEGWGGGAEWVLGNKLFFCFISYINNDISDNLILFSHSEITLTPRFK